MINRVKKRLSKKISRNQKKENDIVIERKDSQNNNKPQNWNCDEESGTCYLVEEPKKRKFNNLPPLPPQKLNQSDNTKDINNLPSLPTLPESNEDLEIKFPYPSINNEWTIYGADWCPYCKGAKKYLDDRNINYVYHDIEKINKDVNGTKYKRSEVQELLKHKIGDYKAIPLVFHKGVFIGGYDDLRMRVP